MAALNPVIHEALYNKVAVPRVKKEILEATKSQNSHPFVAVNMCCRFRLLQYLLGISHFEYVPNNLPETQFVVPFHPVNDVWQYWEVYAVEICKWIAVTEVLSARLSSSRAWLEMSDSVELISDAQIRSVVGHEFAISIYFAGICVPFYGLDCKTKTPKKFIPAHLVCMITLSS